MMSRTTIALAAAAVLGLVSAAQANEPTGQDGGGFKYGPMGQRMGGAPVHWRGHRGVDFGFAFAPGHRRVWHYERDRGW